MAPERVLETLLRLAAEQASRRIRKGDRRPGWIAAKGQATRRRMRERRQREALRRRLAAKPKGVDRRRAFGDRLIDRMVCAMRPGHWYGQRDIVRALGLPRGHNAKVHQDLMPRRLVERRRNPAYRGRVEPQRAAKGLAEPLWLYRLTRLGELHRGAVVLIGAGPV